MKTIKIGNREIGDGHPTFVVGEIGINHQGSVEIAKKLIDLAALAEADAVKFQKRTPNLILTKEALNRPYTGPNSFGETYGKHREVLELSKDDYIEISKYCKEKNIMFFASVWDEVSADIMEQFNVPVYKIASADLTNQPLLEHVAKKGKPVILSTGMSKLEEVDIAVKSIQKYTDELVLMHCVSTYPSEFNQINLRGIEKLKKRYGIPVGYSGHERGIAISLAAVALGANLVERHITLDRTMKGGDHAASLEPQGLIKLIRDIRAFEEAMGTGDITIIEEEIPIRHKLGKSLVARKKIPRGTKIDKSMVIAKSPGTGLPPYRIGDVLGKNAKVEIQEDEQLGPENLQ